MKRRSGMRRRAPIRRSAPMRRGRRSTSYSRRARDHDRMLAVKGMPCALLSPGDAWPGPAPDACRGPIEAHHAGARGLGRKASDDTAIPMCDHHHDDFTERRGIFGGWPRGAARVWQDAMIERYRRIYDEHERTI